MIERAVQRWPMKPEYRDAVVRRLTKIVADPASSAREIASASRTLATIEAQNQADEHLRIKLDKLEMDAPQVNVQVNVGEVRRQVLEELSPASVESIQQQALQDDAARIIDSPIHSRNGHARDVRANGQ